MLVGLNARARAILWPILLFFQAIGDIAWLPILLIWFGFGLTTMTFVIVYTVLFPIVLNTALGVRTVPLDLHRAARCLGASRARVIVEVVLPGALPNIITGLRISFGTGWAAIIAAELVAARSGLGYLISNGMEILRADKVLVGMAVIGVLGVVFDSLFRFIHRRIAWGAV